MIASIRDYAEYVPLERSLFDLVIIDEASQVSIAQALPAFIRAKQLVALGDRRQFSNVKPHELVQKVKEQAAGLANGDMRQCSVCGEIKSTEEFRDMSLARGFGRKCKACKTGRAEQTPVACYKQPTRAITERAELQ